MFTKDFVYVDILSLGIPEETTKIKKLKVTLPILEFSSDSRFYQIVKSHFEYHWKYSITQDEFSYYEPELKEKFFTSSFTGYRLIKQHESWISVDPIVGCSNGCKYCVLRTTFGNDIKPKVYTDPELIGDRLRESKFYHNDAIICLFNYTDALLPENREHIIKCLKVLNNDNFQNWLCIPTKQPFDISFVNRIMESYFKEKLIFLITLSGLSRQFEPKIDKDGVIFTMRMLKEHNIPFIHYWRPITSRNCDYSNIREMINNVSKYAECSVATGLKASNVLNNYYTEQLFLIEKNERKDHGDYLPDGFMGKLKEVIKQNGITYPVYLHMSCAVSKIIGRPDYNGTMFRDSICSMNGASLCVGDQEKICKSFKDSINFNENELRRIINDILPNMDIKIDKDKIELLNPIYQEDLIYLIHQIKWPVVARKILYTNQYVGSILV